MDIKNTEEYRLIENIYGNQTAKRSGVPLIHHIEQGIQVLAWEQADMLTMRAFCLHPIVQDDAALQENFSLIATHRLDPSAVLLTMEYRNIANQYLSHRTIKDISEIALSPLLEVNQMLVADKIQNRKDFELYHLKTHPRAAELSIYFANWLHRLGISEEKYEKYSSLL
jgi:(p)ppGpp synthase/HD superfamily hydrolase